MQVRSWGTTLLGFCIATALASPAQSVQNLFHFNYIDGAFPAGVLTQGSDGNIYGTTNSGSSNKCQGGCGTVFNLSSTRQLTTLHSFVSTDGAFSYAQPVEASDGNFYGTVWGGGLVNQACNPNACGTIFRVTPAGKFTLLHKFAGPDGGNPNSLVLATDGNLYGTTSAGGDKTCNCGTIFRITLAGKFTTLHTFTSGGLSDAPLIQATDGNLYGTTWSGGPSNKNCGGGCGTIFKITVAGAFTTLANFNFSNGAQPYAALVEGANGDFYGTTFSGGNTRCFFGCGTVFRVTPAGQLTVIHRFSGYDGFNPNGLVLATDGNFYGTTQAGNVFKVTAGGTLTSLAYLGGRIPYAGLIQNTNGNFYGTTGANFNCSAKGGDCGWVFEMSVGLKPFVSPSPVAGKVGSKVTILGTNLANVTGVTFNGTPAELLSVTNAAISTEVPSGATSGKVVVTTSNSTLTSNVAFQVVP